MPERETDPHVIEARMPNARKGAITSDPETVVRSRTRLSTNPCVPEILLHTAHERSRLGQLSDASAGRPPYWAYAWAGGVALARYILDKPQTVAGRSVLDLGTGSGLVAIAAAKAGARQVQAADIDPLAIAATHLNAAANGVTIDAILGDQTGVEPPAVDLITVGDLFYAPELAMRMIDFLDRCVASGIIVLVGDPGRIHLPRGRLSLLAEYDVSDFADARPAADKHSSVYAFRKDSG